MFFKGTRRKSRELSLHKYVGSTQPERKKGVFPPGFLILFLSSVKCFSLILFAIVKPNWNANKQGSSRKVINYCSSDLFYIIENLQKSRGDGKSTRSFFSKTFAFASYWCAMEAVKLIFINFFKVLASS